MIKTCLQCGKEFKAHYAKRKCCNKRCADDFRRANKEKFSKQMLLYYATEEGKGRIKRVAAINRGCKRTVEQRKRMSVSASLRSDKSEANRARSRLEFYKTEKGKQLKVKIGNEHRGERSHFWKGGVWTVNGQIRHSEKYAKWRKKVFMRDGFVCQDCGNKGGELNAHHLVSFSEIVGKSNIFSVEDSLLCEELWDVDNGVTLCVPCHQQREMLIKHRRKCFG